MRYELIPGQMNKNQLNQFLTHDRIVSSKSEIMAVSLYHLRVKCNSCKYFKTVGNLSVVTKVGIIQTRIDRC